MSWLPPPSWRRRSLFDLTIAAALAAAAVAVYFWRFPGGVPPEEDAAILMRYVGQLAAGRGIVWNAGERPVDGATDFLFLIAAAAVAKAGASVEGAVRLVALSCHAATIALVFLSIRGLFGASRVVALLPAVFLALGPAPHYVAVGFGTPAFAFAVTASWVLAHLVMESERPTRRLGVLFGMSALVMGLVRPEGVIVAALMLLAIVWYRRGRHAREVLATVAFVFLVLGASYFVWRWSYFGYPLPNPFYKKGGGTFYWGTLAKAFQNLARLTWPFALVLLAGLGRPSTRRYAAAALLPLVGFALAWVLLSDETNYLMRFRYPIVPVAFLSWVPVWMQLRGELGGGRPLAARLLTLAAGALGLASLAWQHGRFAAVPHPRSGLHDVGKLLAAYRDRNYTMAVTEAGLLPFYSGWRAVDAWGLNDPWITHHGGITPDYLDRYRPDLILIHAYYSPEVPRERGAGRGLGADWHRMTVALQDYAEGRRYELAAVFGRDRYETHYYYVRPGCPDAPELVARIRKTEYRWYRDGEPAVRYAP